MQQDVRGDLIERARDAFYRTRSVEETARELGVDPGMAHSLIVAFVTRGREVGAHTF